MSLEKFCFRDYTDRVLKNNLIHIIKLLLQKVVIQEEDCTKYTKDLFLLSVDTGFCICTINTGSVYYEQYVATMSEDGKMAFELLLASFVRTIDEASHEKRPIYKNLMSEWNYKLNKYLTEYLDNIK